MNIQTKLLDFLGLQRKGYNINSGGWVSLMGGKAVNTDDMYSGIMYKCVDLIASNVSTNKFHLYDIRKDEKKIVVNHPLLKLLQRPNKYQTTTDLIYQISSQIDITGVSYLYPVKSIDGSNYLELWVLNPYRVKVIKGTDDIVSHYIYRKEKGGETRFELNELIEIKRPDPFDITKGLSTIQKAKYEIEGVLNAVQWNSNFFSNGAMPSGILTTDQQMTDESFDRLDKEWRTKYEGASNAHKTLLLDGGLRWEQVTLKQKDMDFIKQREFSRDEILAIFGVPKSILYANDVNRANAEAGKYFFAEYTLSPRLDLIFEKLNIFYLSLFKGTEGFELQPENPVPENVEQQLMRKEKSVNRWLTVNEVRQEDGYEPLDGGDILYLPTNLVPSGQDINTNPPQKIIAMKKRISHNDRKYLKVRRSYVAMKEKQMASKIHAHLSYLTDLIRKDDITTKSFKKKANFNEVLSQIMPNLTEWTTLTAKITFDFGFEVLKESVNNTGNEYDLPIDFNLENSGAIAILNQRASFTAKSLTDSTLQQARNIIKDELEKGEVTLEKIKARLINELEIDKTWKAERIARTEINTAYSDGSMLMYKQSEVVTKLKWIAEQDACPICTPNNQEVIDKNGVFISGHSNTPAHPQCRCEVIPYFD